MAILKGVRKDSDEPPSMQVYRMFVGAISDGTLRPGAQLPPERELSTQVGVSRATLRVALRALRDDGVLQPTQGRGWHVVTPSVVEEGHEPPLSFTEIAALRGLTASAEVLNQSTRPATLEEAEDLGIAPGSEVFSLDRLRKLDDVPVAVASALLPVALVREALDADYSTRSLYATLRESCGITPTRSEYMLQARGAEPGEAAQLGLAPGEAVLVGAYTCFDDNDRAFEVGRITYRGDRYRFRTVLRDGRRPLPGD
ncbi:GntR family transcriptional regulator [Actinopolymorpha rutila]